MDNLTYLFESGILVLLFYFLYKILLQRDTLFYAHRWFFIIGMLVVMILPLLEFNQTTQLEIPRQPAPSINQVSMVASSQVIQESTPNKTLDWFGLLFSIYCIGFGLMVVRLLIQLGALLKVLSAGTREKAAHFIHIKTNSSTQPFSFLQYIVYNPSLHSSEELELILAHENIHAKQWHTVDILMAQVLLIVQWFNPLAWLYEKSLRQNLEFIADGEASRKVASTKAYQLALVKVSSALHSPMLANLFYQSLIKKRIVMLNKPSSHKRNLWKLGLVLPGLALFMYSFTINKVVEYVEAPMNDAITLDKLLDTPEDFSNLDLTLADAETESTSKKVNTPATHSQTQFTIAATSTAADLDALENFFEKEITTVDVKIGNRAWTDGKLKSFSLMTRFQKEMHYSTRMSFDATLSKKKFPDYSLEYQDGAIHLTEKGLEGTTAVIDAKQIRLYDPKKTDFTPQSPAFNNSNKAVTLQEEVKFLITSNTTDEELDELKKMLEREHNIDVMYNLRRNVDNEITSIQMNYSQGSKNGNYSINGDEPIDDFYFFISEEGTTGFWSEQREMHRDQMEAQMEARKAAMEARRLSMQERQKTMKEAQVMRKEQLRMQMEARREAMKARSQMMRDSSRILSGTIYGDSLNMNLRSNLFVIDSTGKVKHKQKFKIRTNYPDIAVLITKYSSDRELELYKEEFDKKDLELVITDLKRNKEDVITKISISVNNKNGIMASSSWKEKADGIRPISVGLSNDTAFARTQQ